MCRKSGPSTRGRFSMAAFRNEAPLRRCWFLTLSYVAALGVIVLGTFLWQAIELSSLSTVSARVEAAKPYFSALRFAVIGLLAVIWPRLPAFWLQNGNDKRLLEERWNVLRWRVVGWLLVIELVLGQNLIGRSLTVAVGSAQ